MRERVNTLDLIEVLPPGLYEMILEGKKAEDVGADLLPGQCSLRLRRQLGGRNLNATLVGFQYLADAHRFLAELKQRLKAFALEVHPDKTRIIEFGRFACENRRNRGQGKPETFAFSASPTSSGEPGRPGGWSGGTPCASGCTPSSGRSRPRCA